jgi:hypothetical protein
MPAEDDITIDEKRVYEKTRRETTLYIASELGIARVAVSGDQVGRFSLVERCQATSIAASADHVVAGTDEAVLVHTGDEFESTGFGPAAAVGVDEGRVLAASPAGRVARYDDGWETVGEVTEPRRFDGSLLAGADGVYRVGSALENLGLDSVRDVAGLGPADSLAATGSGLYRHHDTEWHLEAEQPTTAVVADGSRGYAVADGGLLEAELKDDSRTSTQRSVPDGPLADLAAAESLYAVTDDGTVLVAADPASTPDGQGCWRTRALGVRGVVELTMR